jgi:hypothetical protein
MLRGVMSHSGLKYFTVEVVHRLRGVAAGLLVAANALLAQPSSAAEGGVSFWIPGFFGSLAAAPQRCPLPAALVPADQPPCGLFSVSMI